VVLSTDNLENVERSVHVFECLAEISTSVVVESEVGVAKSCLGVVIA